jgi:uncharacterized membrane protein (DUF441 family)
MPLAGGRGLVAAMLTPENIGLIVLLLLGLWARSSLVAAAAAVLLLIRLAHLDFLLPILEERGVKIGLLFLTVAMLVPFALGQVNLKEVVRSLGTLPGILAVIGGAVATHVNGRGLGMLAAHSELMIALIIGSIIGIVVWGGIPVGPLMAAGLTYLMLELVSLVTRIH